MAAVPSATAVLSGLETRRNVLMATLGTLEAEQDRLDRRHAELEDLLASIDGKIVVIRKNMAVERMKEFLSGIGPV